MLRYNTIKYNDIANAPGVSVSIYLQGCPEPHCKGCFNPETWDFQGGNDLNDAVIDAVLEHIDTNNVFRNLCILGGEPLCDENIRSTYLITKAGIEQFPQLKIYVWSKYLLSELQQKAASNNELSYILTHIYCLVDGPFIQELSKINLPMRGSTNQNIYYKENGEWVLG